MKYARGMRKLGIATLLTALVWMLSGCIIFASGPSVSNFQVQSNWTLVSTGEYVLCTNSPSQIGYSFNLSDGTITSITETYVGTASGRTFTFNRNPSTLVKSGNTYTALADVAFGQNGLPQSLGGGVSSQAIVVTPTPAASQNGETTLRITLVVDGFTFQSPSRSFKTFANCPRS
jgi:hypothetical protein